MKIDDKIYVAGHRGLVGSALVESLEKAGYSNLILKSREELDLLDSNSVKDFFQSEKPKHVFFAAAKVGGIMANNSFPAEFIYENLQIQTRAIHEAWRSGVDRFLFLGSSCIYPRNCPQPMKEEYLLSGLLEPTNRPYAIAKIAGIECCWSYNRQYGSRFLSVMPTNLFGDGDNYDPETSHALPALIRKIHEAKVKGDNKFVIWGTGEPRREYMYSKDLADACVYLMKLPDNEFNEIVNPNKLPLINIGTGEDMTIRELAELVAKVIGYQGEFEFDTSRPDGMPQKLLDITNLKSLGWESYTELTEAIGNTYQDYLQSISSKN